MSTTAALKLLFELLEDYAPVWYTEEHHNLAVDALTQAGEYLPTSPRVGGSEGTARNESSSPQSQPLEDTSQIKNDR
jgi:hypothetical protein